jgi:hypothetical protein
MRWRPKVALSLALCLSAFFWLRVIPVSGGPSNEAAKFFDSYRWHIGENWFGGFSGLEISDDGQILIAVSDRGQIVKASIARRNGRITGVSLLSRNQLLKDDSVPVKGNRSDAEGLAISSDGTIFVSFEYVGRVWQYSSMDSKAGWASYSKSWRDLPGNNGMEALAVDTNGTLYAVVETSAGNRGQARVYRKEPRQKWAQPFTVPLHENFLPVGADFGPDGRLYLLERAVTPIGFRSRVRRFDVTDTGFKAEKILFTTAPLRHDNLEGLSVWKDDEGRIRLTMISDDNFMFFQRTEIVEYNVAE